MNYCFNLRRAKGFVAAAMLAVCGVFSGALAGPYDVRDDQPQFAPEAPLAVADEPEGHLQPHQQLHAPARRAPKSQLPPPPPTPDVAANNSSGIVIGETTPLLAQFGVVQPSAAGFSPEVWQYMNVQEATALLAKLNGAAEPALLYSRIKALLLLEALPPRKADAAWFHTRLEALKRIGALSEAASLVGAVPPSLLDGIDGFALFTLLAGNGALEKACSMLSPDAKPADVDSAQWVRLTLVCAAKTGDYAQVELATALAEERGIPFDAWFVQLLEHLQYAPQVPLPQVPSSLAPLDKLVFDAIAAEANAAATAAPVAAEKPYPMQPAYAPLAIAKLIRERNPQATKPWLELLDRASAQSAANSVMHDLVRFMIEPQDKPRSQEVNALPPFTAIATASKADMALLQRYYDVMDAFGYDVPTITLEWLAQQGFGASEGASPAAPELEAALAAGNKAGYVLQLPAWLARNPLANLSGEVLKKRLEELRLLGEEELAKQIAAEAILQKLQ